MRNVRITVAALTLAAGALLGLRADGAEDPRPAPAAKPVAPPTPEERANEARRHAATLDQLLKDLAEENSRLKLENDTLKRQLRQLRERRPAVDAPPAQPRPAQPPQAEGDRLPDGSVPQEYNGIRYYVVPLAE